MPGDKSNTRTDPELVRQLDAAREDDQSIEAVFMLHPDNTSESVPSAERTEELTHLVLARVKRRTGQSEDRVNVFKQLGSFVVSASPTFIRQIIAEPEIAAAVANRQPGSTGGSQSSRPKGRSKGKKKGRIVRD